MSRNNNSHFEIAPQVAIERSSWNMPQTVKTSFNVGELVPFYVSEILPGDTWSVDTHKLVRMQTLKTPMMDDIFLDTYYFFVPNRLVWTHWQNFMGESSKAWLPNVEYTIPQLEAPENGWNVGTVADYMGIPPKIDNIKVNALPFRAYAKICEDWFRDVNLEDALVIYDGDSDIEGVNDSGSMLVNPAKGGKPFIAAKLHDYYSACLPQPQRGEDVTLNLYDGNLPVYTVPYVNDYYQKKAGEEQEDYVDRLFAGYPMSWLYNPEAGNSVPAAYTTFYNEVYDPLSTNGEKAYDGVLPMTSKAGDVWNGEHTPLYIHANEDTFEKSIKEQKTWYATKGSSTWLNSYPMNLVTHLPNSIFTINELRQAFQIQRFYEKSARGGNRYIEMLKAHFGVTSPDARLQRAEYLGGNRTPLNIRQVTQTSETTDISPLGDLAGISVTGDNNHDFTKSFTEHGYIIGLMVARYRHTYQQGIERTFSRKTRFDYYWPTFAHLGEQPVRVREIYATASEDVNDMVFGYQEAWADYRYKPNRISGMMRTDSNSGLDTWHLADWYIQMPTLGSSWIKEDATNVDRVLSVSSQVSNQLFLDVQIDSKVTRPMPLYSIPGLIDHF